MVHTGVTHGVRVFCTVAVVGTVVPLSGHLSVVQCRTVAWRRCRTVHQASLRFVVNEA